MNDAIQPATLFCAYVDALPYDSRNRERERGKRERKKGGLLPTRQLVNYFLPEEHEKVDNAYQQLDVA